MLLSDDRSMVSLNDEHMPVIQCARQSITLSTIDTTESERNATEDKIKMKRQVR